MAIEGEFQALTLAEAHEETRAYEAQSHKSLAGWGLPKAMKPMVHTNANGVGLLSQEFQKRGRRNRWISSHNDYGDQAPR